MKANNTRFDCVTIVTLLILVFVVFITYHRIHYGVDLTDESLFATIPYRFTLGDRPFVDEMNFTQTASMLVYPLVKLRSLWVNDSTGLVLYTRHLYLIFNALVGMVLFLFLRKLMGWRPALLVAAMSLAFIPLNTPNLSYNTLGMGFFTLGSVLVALSLLEPGGRWFRHMAGFFHGLAAFAYPPLIIMILIYAFLFYRFTTAEKKAMGHYLIGIIPVGVFLGAFLLNTGWEELRTALTYLMSRKAIHNLGLVKIGNIIWNVISKYPLFLPFSLILCFLYRRHFKEHPERSRSFLFFVPVLPLFIFGFPVPALSLGYIGYYAMLAPYLYLCIREKKTPRLLLQCIWVPSFAAALIYAICSSNYHINLGFGFFPGSIVTSYLLGVLIHERFPDEAWYPKISVGVFSGILLFLLVFQYVGMYRDGNFFELTARIGNGPYQGIYTTVAKKEFLERLSGDLREFRTEKRIFFYDYFPGGYLLSPLRPTTNACWLFPISNEPTFNRGLTLEYFRRKKILPDVVVKLKQIPYNNRETNTLYYLGHDVIDRFFTMNYRLEKETDNYMIYRKPNDLSSEKIPESGLR